MSGPGFRFDFSDVERGLRAMAAEGKSSRLLSELKAPLREDQRDHARDQEGPEGAWAPRAQSTIERARSGSSKRRARGANRRILGSLPRRTISVKSDGRSVVAYSKVPWAGIHQHGGTAGRGSRIPRRPFLWFSLEFLETAASIVRRGVLRAFGGGR